MLKPGVVIISATSFRKSMTQYLDKIDKKQGPVFITLNGEGTHVLMHIDAYNELKRYKDWVLEHRINMDEKNNHEPGIRYEGEHAVTYPDDLPLNEKK